MASTGKTPNLGLSAWTLSDKPQMADFNEDNQILDGVVQEMRDLIASQGEKSGTWQPAVPEGFTINTLEANYRVAGTLCWVELYGVVEATGTPAADEIFTIAGLPFVNSSHGALSVGYGNLGANLGLSCHPGALVSTSRLRFTRPNGTYIQNEDIRGPFRIVVTGTYPIQILTAG